MIEYDFFIVEDNRVDRLIVTTLLMTRDYVDNIYFASDGVEAIDFFVRNDIEIEKPLVILLDINMPKINGFEFLDYFDTLDEKFRKNVIIYMLSSSVDPSDKEKANSHKHVKGFLTKPFKIDELDQYLKEDSADLEI